MLLLPVVNAAADVTTNYFPAGTLNPGALRAMLTVGVLLWLATRRLRLPAATWVLVCFLTYLLVRSGLSNDPARSLTDFSKVALSSAMLIVGYHYVRRVQDLHRLHRALLAAAAVVTLQFAFAQVFRIGESVYVDDSFYLGGALASTVYYLGLAVLVAPVLIPAYRSRIGRIAAVVVLLACVVIMVVLLKRAAIAAVLLGGGAYVLYSGRWGRAARYGTVVAVLLVALAPAYLPVMAPRIEARFSEKQRIERQARYAETLAVWGEFVNRPRRHAVIGSDLFNSASYFGRGRQLHIDFNILLHGSGIIGLLLYLGLVWSILHEHRGYHASARRFAYAWELRAVFIAVVVFAGVVSFSYSLMLIGYRSVLFLYVGALLGVHREIARMDAGSTLPAAATVPPPPRHRTPLGVPRVRST